MSLTLAELDKMSGDQYAEKLNTDPNFRAEVDALLNGQKTAPASAPAPVATEQDPSMPERPTVAAPVNPQPNVPPAPVAAPAPTPVAPPAPVEVPEQRYEWQPRDEQGRPIGGKQVYVYRNATPLPKEILEQVTKGHEMAIRQLRKVNREKVLGIESPVPNDAEKFDHVTEFKSRDLTAQERFDLAQKLTNPETFEEGRNALIESALGASPKVLTQTLNELTELNIQQKAFENYVAFIETNGVPDTASNREVLIGWMRKNKLRPTVANFNLALSVCRESGLIQDLPAVQQAPVVPPAPPVVEQPRPVEVVANPQPPVAAPTRISDEPQPQAKRHSHVPSGLNASIASAAGPLIPVDGNSLTLADIDKMSGDEYKRRAKDPAFMKLVDKLETEAMSRRRARALGQV